MPSTSTRTRSPGRRYSGGTLANPTPAGVPVDMSARLQRDVLAEERDEVPDAEDQVGGVFVLLQLVVDPEPDAQTVRLRRSSTVAIQGPIGLNVSKDFARVNCPSAN